MIIEITAEQRDFLIAAICSHQNRPERFVTLENGDRVESDPMAYEGNRAVRMKRKLRNA